jgi:hypothetical protein
LISHSHVPLAGVFHRDPMTRARAFDGCIDLAITADAVDPRRVSTVEVWDSAMVLDAWRKQANPPDTGSEAPDVHMRRFDAEAG